ncbi:MAG: hypothetical protein RR384_05590, partial [Acidaminococcaceae bacterium]
MSTMDKSKLSRAIVLGLLLTTGVYGSAEAVVYNNVVINGASATHQVYNPDGGGVGVPTWDTVTTTTATILQSGNEILDGVGGGNALTITSVGASKLDLSTVTIKGTVANNDAANINLIVGTAGPIKTSGGTVTVQGTTGLITG